MRTLLSDADWADLTGRSRQAEAAHAERRFADEVGLLREMLARLVAALGVRGPAHAGDVAAPDVEAALAVPGACYVDRATAVDFAARLGTLSAMEGNVAGALPWLDLADRHLPGILAAWDAEGLGMPSFIRDNLAELRRQVAYALGALYREHGHAGIGDWHQSVSDGAGDQAAQDTESDRMVAALHALEIAGLMQADGRLAEALALLDARAESLRRHAAPSWLQELVAARADELAALGRDEPLAARAAVCRQDRCIREIVPDGRGLTFAMLARSALRHALRAGREDLAWEDAAATLALVEGRNAAPRGFAWRVYLALANHAVATHRPWAACLYLKLAVEQFHLARHCLAPAAPGLAAEPDDDAFALHDGLARNLVALGRLNEASEAVELGLLRAGPPSAPSMTAVEAEAARRIKTALDGVGTGRGPHRPLAEALAGAMELAEAAGRHRPDPDAGSDTVPQARAATALPEGAAASTALVHYAVEAAGALAVVRAGEREAAVPLDVPGAAWLHRMVFAALRAVAAAREDPIPHLQRLYDVLLRPLEPHLGEARRVVVAAPAALQGLPWAALHDGERYAVQRRSWLRAAPGVDLLCPPARAVRAAVCAGTRAGAGFEALGAAAEAEAEAVAATWSGIVLRDDEFTFAALTAAVRSATVLHVASHFAADPGQIDRSRLLLGDGTVLTLADLVGLGLSRLDLVVLSACRSATAAGEAAGAATAVDAALHGAGARAVVGMLWSVDSEATRRLMQAFHGQLSLGTDKDEALARAQRSMLAGEFGGEWTLPVFWAAPVPSGNWLGWR